MDYLQSLSMKLQSLVVFRALMHDKVLRLLPPMLSLAGKSPEERLARYSNFVSALFCENENLTDYIFGCLCSDQNIYAVKRARKQDINPALRQCVSNELKVLEEAARLEARQVIAAVGYGGYLPEWQNRPLDFAKEYEHRLNNVSRLGYGIFARHRMFFVEDKRIVPIAHPDPVRLSELIGYENERRAVVENTLALLNGRPAANVLLYGDAGTGKSSTVKAVVNEYAHEGLRLIEIRKNQLSDIPAVVERLHDNPLKFILFIDDLSFSCGEDFGGLKAVLEGTARAKAPNIAIYATSNRRRLINETFSSRDGDDIHKSETIQEQVSLSERFGLPVNFARPGKEEYLYIVRGLAAQYGLRDTGGIDQRAERYALSRGGRSPRVARQFVERLKSMEH